MNRSILACVLAAVTLGLAAPLAAQDADHEHAGHEMPVSGELERPGYGGKWPADESLREGMTRLHSAFASHHADYQEGRFDGEQAEQLAAGIEEAVSFMFANCQLPPAADAELHKLLAASLGAARTLRRSDEPHRGLHELHQVLEAYPDYFDHPGWPG